MKKIILASVAALALMFAASSCTSKTVEEKAQEWAEKLQKAIESKNKLKILAIGGQAAEWYEKLSEEDKAKVDALGLDLDVDPEDVGIDMEGIQSGLESLFE